MRTAGDDTTTEDAAAAAVVDAILDLVPTARLRGDEPPEITAAVARGVGTVIKVVAAGSAARGRVHEHDADIVMVDAPTPGRGVPFD